MLKTKRTPTFKIDGVLLVGADAKTKWAAQRARCGCGSYGDAEESIGGKCSDMPTEWLGCPNCSGQALGKPLVYRLQSQILAAK